MKLSSPWRAALLLAALAGCARPETEAPPDPDLARPESRPETDVATAALLRETSQLYRQGRYPEGLARLEAELRRDPDRPRLHHNLGIFRAALGDYEGAVAAFEEELARHGSYLDSHRGLATAYSRLGQPEDSIVPFESCLAADPDDVVCAFGLGRNLSILGLFDQAVPHLERAAELRRDAEGWSELGILYRRLGDLERSAGVFGQALAADPVHLKTLLGYGQTLTALGRDDDGEALLERHKRLAELDDQLEAFERARQRQAPRAEDYLDLARIHLERDDRPAAIEAYRQAMARDAGSPVAALELAELQLEDGRLADAEPCVEHALTADPEGPGPRFYDGLVKLAAGDLAAAGQAVAAALERGGWPPPAFLDAGDAYRDAGDLDRAAAAYLEAMRLAPEDPLTHYKLALAAREHGDQASAEQAVRRAVELDPDAADAWTLLGTLRFEAGDARQAEEAFRHAIATEEPLTLLRADGVEQVLEEFPGGGEAREAYRRLLTEHARTPHRG